MRRSLANALFALCIALPAAAQTFVGAMSGSWWDASRAGEGQFITFETVGGRSVAYLAYFTYSADGRASWHVGNADYAPGATSITIPLVTGGGPQFGAGYRSADVRIEPAGTATLEFVSCTRLRMRHTGIEGATLDLTRLVGPLAGAGCGERPPPATSLTGVVSGSWWNASRGGEGQFITFETVGARVVAYVAYFTYTDSGAPTWLVGNADIPIGARSVSIPLVTGAGARFGAAFRAQDVTVASAGTATLEFVSCSALRLTYAGQQTFALDLTRLVGPMNGIACVDGFGGTPQADETHFDQLASTHTGFTYPISMYFPPGYVPGSANHPVIYTADSELTFAVMVDLVRTRGYNAIVVGIGNGGTNRRFVDYELPGGAAYFRFLALELMPFIETRFRVDRTRRTYVGYSLSGSHTAIALFLEDPADRRFSAFVSVDGAYWSRTDSIYALEQAYFDRTRVLPVKMFLASAANRPSITAFRERVESRGYQGLRLREDLYQLSHAGVLSPGLADGLAYVFAGD